MTERILSKSKLGREEENVPAPTGSFIQPDKARGREKLPELNDDKEKGKEENWEKNCGFRRKMSGGLKRIDIERIKKETARNTSIATFQTLGISLWDTKKWQIQGTYAFFFSYGRHNKFIMYYFPLSRDLPSELF